MNMMARKRKLLPAACSAASTMPVTTHSTPSRDSTTSTHRKEVSVSKHLTHGSLQRPPSAVVVVVVDVADCVRPRRCCCCCCCELAVSLRLWVRPCWRAWCWRERWWRPAPPAGRWWLGRGEMRWPALCECTISGKLSEAHRAPELTPIPTSVVRMWYPGGPSSLVGLAVWPGKGSAGCLAARCKLDPPAEG